MQDMSIVKEQTDYVTGYSGQMVDTPNPSYYIAMGVMQAYVQQLNINLDRLSLKTNLF